MGNTLTDITPQLLAQGLQTLRKMAVMPQLVNRGYEPLAGEQGSTIDVPVPSAVAVQDVVPAATHPAGTNLTPTKVPITLNRWKEAAFDLDDRELMQIQKGTIPMQAREAIKALADELDSYLLSLGSQFYGIAGTPGTVPFANEKTTDASALRTVLNRQLAPFDPRHVVLDPDAEGSALNVRAFQDASFGGGVEALMKGRLNEKLGFRWWMDQNVRSHTAGTGAGYLINTASNLAAGTKTIPVDTGTGTILVGDIVKFANHSQTYVVTSALSGGSFAIEPGLLVSVANNSAVTAPGDTGGYGSHVMNLGFHRDAIALATRPLARSVHPSAVVETMTDPISGLTLRLELHRLYKKDRWSFDILYGAAVIRRELGARLAG